jgi:hypothetical protein
MPQRKSELIFEIDKIVEKVVKNEYPSEPFLRKHFNSVLAAFFKKPLNSK